MENPSKMDDLGGKPTIFGNIQMFAEKTDPAGQIIATSHDLTPNGGLVRESPYFREIWVGGIQ